jgi:bacillithiol system protein YtxJ
MNWIDIESVEKFQIINNESFNNPIIIFKHSIRCSISDMALNRFERSWTNPNIQCYFVDLIQFRNISTAISDNFNIPHESPQLLIISNGVCIYNASHSEIRATEVEKEIQKLNNKI